VKERSWIRFPIASLTQDPWNAQERRGTAGDNVHLSKPRLNDVRPDAEHQPHETKKDHRIETSSRAQVVNVATV
jgi:hypothetical protein